MGDIMLPLFPMCGSDEVNWLFDHDAFMYNPLEHPFNKGFLRIGTVFGANPIGYSIGFQTSRAVFKVKPRGGGIENVARRFALQN